MGTGEKMNLFSEAMAWVEEQHAFPEDLRDFHSLRFQEIARRSGLFEQAGRIVVVAGSCGKASTARFLGCMLRDAGHRVGLGTKPPLSESADGHRERYQLFDHSGEHWISAELFCELVTELQTHSADLPQELGPLAPYDLRAWILLRAFQRWGVDVGIVEANIGLRNDPAGAVPAELTVLTPIITDHAQMLQAPPEWSHLGVPSGPLWHKLSACPSARVVVGRQPSISHAELDRLMDRPGPRMGRDFFLEEVSSGLWGSRGKLSFKDLEVQLELGCLGEFQVENAATAAVAFVELMGPSHLDAVRSGARSNQIPGRLQVLGREPLELLCVASSKAKVEAMIASLESLYESEQARLVMTLSLLDRVHGKEDVVAYLASHPRLRMLVVTQCEYPDDSRDLPADELARLATAANPRLEVLACTDPDEAVRLARANVGPGEIHVLLGNGLAANQSQKVF